MTKRHICYLAIFFSTSCAGPNPNVGLRTADLMIQNGNCKKATEILNDHATRGEPWAQLRLGWFSFTKQCPGVSVAEGITWLTKAACYVPRTDWEKGSEFSNGPIGFFNTRASSTEAADALRMVGEANKDLATAWSWINRAAAQYEDGNPVKTKLLKLRGDLESKMTPEMKEKGSQLNPCAKSV